MRFLRINMLIFTFPCYVLETFIMEHLCIVSVLTILTLVYHTIWKERHIQNMVLSSYQHAARWELYLFNTLSVILIFRTDLIICSCFLENKEQRNTIRKKQSLYRGKTRWETNINMPCSSPQTNICKCHISFFLVFITYIRVYMLLFILVQI